MKLRRKSCFSLKPIEVRGKTLMCLSKIIDYANQPTTRTTTLKEANFVGILMAKVGSTKKLAAPKSWQYQKWRLTARLLPVDISD